MKSPSVVKTAGTGTFLYPAVFFSTGLLTIIYAVIHSDSVFSMKTTAAVSISGLLYEENRGIYIPALSDPSDTVTDAMFRSVIFPSFASSSSSFLHIHALIPRTSGAKTGIQTYEEKKAAVTAETIRLKTKKFRA